jgi:hypothetical protein
MYEDEKTWKEHYEDWKHIVERLRGNDAGLIFRLKIVQGLIDDYERSSHG